MLETELPDPPTGSEPTPQFATDAEVAFAERLRHKLEEIYFGHAVGPSELPGRPSEIH